MKSAILLIFHNEIGNYFIVKQVAAIKLLRSRYDYVLSDLILLLDCPLFNHITQFLWRLSKNVLLLVLGKNHRAQTSVLRMLQILNEKLIIRISDQQHQLWVAINSFFVFLDLIITKTFASFYVIVLRIAYNTSTKYTCAVAGEYFLFKFWSLYSHYRDCAEYFLIPLITKKNLNYGCIGKLCITYLQISFTRVAEKARYLLSAYWIMNDFYISYIFYYMEHQVETYYFCIYNYVFKNETITYHVQHFCLRETYDCI